MAENHYSQLLKGVLPMLILAMLSSEESYGYELVVHLQESGLSETGAGTVYPVLTRLEREGKISSRLVPSKSGPARKYYSLTSHGHQALADMAQSWQSLASTVQPILNSTQFSEKS